MDSAKRRYSSGNSLLNNMMLLLLSVWKNTDPKKSTTISTFPLANRNQSFVDRADSSKLGFGRILGSE